MAFKSDILLKYLFTAVGVTGLFLMAVGLGIYLGLDDPRADSQIGLPSPETQGTTARGESIDLADMRGDVVLVDFWATWCGACLRELPRIASLQEKYADQGLRVLGISGDLRAEDLLRYEEKNNLPFPSIHDPDGKLFSRWAVRNLPTLVVVDREGVVTYRGHGRGLESAITAALGQEPL